MVKLVSKRFLVCVAALALFATVAAPAANAWIIRGGYLSYFLYGANSQGNRCSQCGSTGQAKFYKFSNSGAILGVGKGYVTNWSGWPQFFLNQGNSVVDPQTSYSYSSTSDLQTISGRRGYRRARTSLLLAYNPRYSNGIIQD